MRTMLYLLSLVAAALMILSSCSTPRPAEPDSEPEPAMVTKKNYEPVQEKLVEGAFWAVGRSDLTVNGRTFGLDCTGSVLAAYWYAGIDLAKEFGRFPGNGVKKLYYYLEERDLLYKTKYPAPGDIIFWNDSWDANGNGRADDPLTHVGMIVSMDQMTGQGTYMHHNYSKGIEIVNINFVDRDNYSVNSPMRMKSLPRVEGYKFMASQLMQDLARGYELPLDSTEMYR